MTEAVNQVPLFNSPLETGVRAAVLLNAAYPDEYDLTTLTLLDHLVVHTEDFGGPPSIHPSIPQRTGELLVRRKIVEQGLVLMRRLHLIDVQASEHGIYYRASDEAASILDLMHSNYSTLLKERAAWLIDIIKSQGVPALRAQAEARLGHWATEFQDITAPSGSVP